MIIGMGVDIIEIARVRQVLERHTDRFADRVFTEAEQEYCRAHRNPAPHYAVRFAAKEALFKALGTGWAQGVTWKDAEVVRLPQQAPKLVLHGKADELSREMGTSAVHVTLSHSNESAVAVVILEK